MTTQQGNRRPEATSCGLCKVAGALFVTCAATGAAAAATSHGAHEHGTAEIELAVEGSDVVVNFASPLYNLVGFEHAPRDERDREAVAAARALLDDPGNLVRFQADAACTVVELDIHWDAPAADEEEHDHDEAAEHDAHGDHHAGEHEADDTNEHDAHEADDHEADAHDAEEHHDHDADEHDKHDADEQHADVSVAIRYQCDHPDRLNTLDITAFASFERLSEVELRAVGPGGAVAESPERGTPRVDLSSLFGR